MLYNGLGNNYRIGNPDGEKNEVGYMGFFDKLKEQASSISSQLDQALDSTKQKSQLNTMRKQREQMVGQLGEALLNQFRQNQVNPEELRPQVEQVFNLEREMMEVEKQIEAQKQASAQAPPQATAPPPAPATAPPPPPAAAPAPPGTAPAAAAVTCPSCGGETPEGSAFCPNCGNRIA